MSYKPAMQEHPLFNNRKRVLVVPASTQKNDRHWRNLMGNLMVAGLVLATFITGFTTTSPAASQALGGFIGSHWNEAMVRGFGVDQGAILAEKSPWIMARAGGIVSYLMMFASVALGLLNSLRLTDRFIHRGNLMYVHKIISLFTVIFTTMHVAGLMLDSYANFSISDVLFPFTASYDPFWSGMGTLGMYGIVALIASFYLFKKVSYKIWRYVHYLSFAVFYMTLFHGLVQGTDSKSIWMQLTYFITGLAISYLTGMRIFTRITPPVK